MSLPESNKTILASEYKLYQPTTEQLVGVINEAKEHVKKRIVPAVQTQYKAFS